MIASIPTVYRGIQFRSRLEAKWAAFFDTCEWPWLYEPKDFNGWIPEGNEMQSIGGIWSKTVPLPPGRYHYRYVVDGRWLTDPLNVNVEPTPWGGYNSVINLGGNNLRLDIGEGIGRSGE